MMKTDYSEPVDWKAVTLAFVVWAAHFSILWGANSIFPDAPISRWIALAVTLAALAALAWIVIMGVRGGPRTVPRLAGMVAGLSVLFGALPALIG